LLRAGREQPVHVGREQARQRRLPLDHLERRLLLTEEVLVRTGDDVDRAVGADPGALELLDGASHSGDLALEARLQTDEGLVRANRERGDDQALDDLIWI